jgi:hypothetical protein
MGLEAGIEVSAGWGLFIWCIPLSPKQHQPVRDSKEGTRVEVLHGENKARSDLTNQAMDNLRGNGKMPRGWRDWRVATIGVHWRAWRAPIIYACHKILRLVQFQQHSSARGRCSSNDDKTFTLVTISNYIIINIMALNLSELSYVVRTRVLEQAISLEARLLMFLVVVCACN